MSDSQQQQQQPVIDPIAALAAVTAAEQSTDATPATALEEPEPEGYNGDLPEFSDSEDTPPPATSSKVPVARPKSGPPGKGKKVPLAALKKKLAGGAAAVSASVASSSSSSSSKDKQKAKAVEDDNGAVAATEQKLKGMKLSDSQLDAVIAQLVKNQPHLEGKVSRADAQAFINSTGMNKKVLEGKEGLFGKTVSDMGCVLVAQRKGCVLDASSDMSEDRQIPQVLVNSTGHQVWYSCALLLTLLASLSSLTSRFLSGSPRGAPGRSSRAQQARV